MPLSYMASGSGPGSWVAVLHWSRPSRSSARAEAVQVKGASFGVEDSRRAGTGKPTRGGLTSAAGNAGPRQGLPAGPRLRSVGNEFVCNPGDPSVVAAQWTSNLQAYEPD
jgi:hypothetical protein